jgi:hypothetical protein
MSSFCCGWQNALIQPSRFASADTPPQAQLASGSAVLSMSRQLGSAIGVAILVALLGDRPAGTLAGFRRPWIIVIVTATITAAGLAVGRRTGGDAQPIATRTVPAADPARPPAVPRAPSATPRDKHYPIPTAAGASSTTLVETVFIAACSGTRQASERAAPQERRRACSRR